MTPSILEATGVRGVPPDGRLSVNLPRPSARELGLAPERLPAESPKGTSSQRLWRRIRGHAVPRASPMILTRRSAQASDSLPSRMTVRSGTANPPPADAGWIPPLTRPCTWTTPVAGATDVVAAGFGAGVLGRRAHKPPDPWIFRAEDMIGREPCGVPEFRRVLRTTWWSRAEMRTNRLRTRFGNTRRVQARTALTTSPCTSVSRKSRPWKR